MIDPRITRPERTASKDLASVCTCWGVLNELFSSSAVGLDEGAKCSDRMERWQTETSDVQHKDSERKKVF